MLKSIIFLLELIVFVLAVVVFSLLYGITLPNLSYENISISKLYIKYDKKLIVQTNSLKIFDEINKQSHNFALSFDFDYYDDKYYFNIKNLHYKNQDLILKTKIKLTKKEIINISNFKIDNLALNNFSLKFDKNIKAIKTNVTYITYSNDNIYFKLSKPVLNKIKLDKSMVILNNISKNMNLDLQLYINHSLDKKLLGIIKYYGVDLKLKQSSGDNKIFIKANIPFNDDKISLFVNVISKNSSILYDKKLIKSKQLNAQYKDDILNINLTKGIVKIKDEHIDFNDLNLTYKNDKLNMFSKKINYKSNDLYSSFFNANMKYNKNIFYLKANKAHIKIKNQVIKFNNINLKYLENKTTLKSQSANLKYKNKNLELNDLTLNYSKHNTDINSSYAKIKLFDKKIILKNLILGINGNIINISTKIIENKNIMHINSTINTKKEVSYGKLKIKKFVYNDIVKIKNENFAYELNYTNNKYNVLIPKYKINYLYDGKVKHLIKLNELEILLKNLSFLEFNYKNKKSTAIIKTLDNFKYTNILINNLHTNFNHNKYKKSKFKIAKNNNNSLLNIQLDNSVIGYDKRYLYIENSKINMKNNKTNININLIDNSNIKVELYKNDINLVARNLSSNLINRLIKKDKIKGGKVDIDIVGNKNTLNGHVKLNKNTIRNVRVINNLIAFVNTTPAYFNPLLALPTLFKLNKTGFDLNGYYIKDGNFNFKYNRNNEILNVSSLFTRGLMADFKGSVISNFKNKTINANLDVIFLKDYSRIVKDIPILGYIIVGDDGNFQTKIDLEGTFEKQTFETHIIKDSSNGILNAIKRTISIPLLPFKDLKE